MPLQNSPGTRLSTEASPLGRFYEREAGIAQTLLPVIRADLEYLVQVCDGERRQTNNSRSLLADLVKGAVPASWRKFRCREMVVSAWIGDLVKRLAQLERVVRSAAEASEPISLGLLFNPTGFVTATRQTVAHTLKVSLEELTLDVVLDHAPPAHGFAIEGEQSRRPFQLSGRMGFKLLTPNKHYFIGLTLTGATCQPDGLHLNDGSPVQLGTSALIWRAPKEVNPASTRRRVELPCFLDSTRADLLFHIAIDTAPGVDAMLVVQRAVAVIAATD